MGHDIYVVYGIPFDYDENTGKSLDWLPKLVVPDIIEKHGEKAWAYFDDKPHAGGYYLLKFTNDGKLFVACWFVVHQIARYRGDPQLLEMPSEHKKEKFLNWCTNNNIDSTKAGFYTIIDD